MNKHSNKMLKVLICFVFVSFTLLPQIASAWLVELASLANTGAQAEKYKTSEYSSLSADGRYVSFSSSAANLVTGDTNAKNDVFVRDRKLGTTTRISVTNDGAELTDYATYDSRLSGDGRFVVFTSQSSQLAPGETIIKKQNIYVHELATGKNTLLTKGYDGSAADDSSAWNSEAGISADGRYVVFESFATNLVEGDTNAKTDIFIYDREAKTMSIISRSHDGGLPNNNSNDPAISADGRYVVYISSATNLVDGLTVTKKQIYRTDRQTGATVLVSTAPDGSGANQDCYYPSISGDGRFVAFAGAASNLTEGIASGNTKNQIFFRDMNSSTVILVSKNAQGDVGDDEAVIYSGPPKVSPDGRYILFTSKAQNLLTDNSTIASYNAFIYDHTEKTLDIVNRTTSGAKPSNLCISGDIANEAMAVTFTSSASNLVSNDTNSSTDVFLALKTTDEWSIGPTSQIGGWRNDLAVSGNIAAVGEGKSINIYDISGETIHKLSCLSLPVEPTALAISGTKLYAVSGTWEETPLFIVADITDSSAPSILGACTGGSPEGGTMVVNGHYVYYSATASGGWQAAAIDAVDVSNPESPAPLGSLNLGDDVTAHAFTIAGNYLYVQGIHNAEMFMVYNLANPISPAITGELAVGSGETSSALHASGSYVFSAVGSKGVRIIDVSIPSSPSPRQLFSIDGASAEDIYVEDSTLYVAGGDGGVIVFNVSDPMNPVRLGSPDPKDSPFRIDGSTGGVAALFHESDYVVRTIGFSAGSPVYKGNVASPMMMNDVTAVGDFLYGGGDGLLIYDSQDPADPQPLATEAQFKYFTPLNATETRLVGLSAPEDGYQKNIFSVINITNPSEPVLLGSYTSADAYSSGFVSGTLAFLMKSEAGKGADIIDFSNPDAPAFIGSIPFQSLQQDDIVASGTVACIAGQTSQGNRVHIFDITSPSSPVFKSELIPSGNMIRLWITGTLLFVSSNSGETNFLEAFNLNEPAVPVQAGNIQSDIAAYDLDVLFDEEQDPIILLAKPGGSVHTYGYTPPSGAFYPGPVCPSPYSHTVSVSQTPNSTGGYTVVSSDQSYGTYIQEITRKPTTCCLTTSVSPAEAAAKGCKAEPTRVDPVECGGTVTVTATAMDPWVFKEWTGAASGTNPIAEATVTGSCSEAVAVFWAPTLTLGTGTLNPSYETEFYGIEGEFDYANGRKNVVANHISLTANEVDDWLVKSLTYHTSGAGNEKDDITEARLYLNSVGGALLGTGTFSADNANISFSFTHTIPRSSSSTFVLVYDYKPERAWPCNDYRTKIDMGDVNAIPVNLPPGMKIPSPPNGAVHGAIVVKRGDITIIDGDRQYGEAEDPLNNKPLEKPLKTRLKWQHPDTINFISYDIMSPVNSAFLGGAQGTTRVEKQPDAEGYVEETMTLGDKKGQRNPYYVQIGISQKGATCYSSWAPPIFTEWGLGIDLGTESQYDNPQNGDSFGTFLSNIQADNKFTLTIDMAPPDYAQVEEVIFKLDDETKTGNVVTQNKVYDVQFDMSNFTSSVTRILYVTIVMTKDGSQIEQKAEYRVKSIALPSWVNTIGSICHEESFTKEFSGDDGGTYTLSFNYPTNFAWSDYVPGDIGLLGGLKNDLDIEFSASASYKVDEHSTFGATVKGQPVILGKEFSLEGGLSGEFDPSFAFQRGSGNLKASFSFDLPEKGYSKTFLIYGVPVTASVDLSGNVEIFIKGSAVLNRKLEFEKISVAPGTTITGNITISLSAVFGLAKISATGSPTATVEIEVTYTTGAGTTTKWSGEIVVPIKVVGSVFWGLGSAELCSTQLGPWKFGSGGSSPQAFRPLGNVEGPAVPRLLSTSSMAIDADGKRMTLWIDDSTPNESSPNPDVYFRYYNGSIWTDSAPVIGSSSPNSEWETDPKTVFMAGDAALAAWTSNKGDKTLNDLNSILANQDIVFSVWNGSIWSAPVRIIDDAEADGTVSLAYDAANQNAFAVWVHNADSENAMARTEWKLMYSVFDSTANQGEGGFGLPADVPGTDASSADQMPVLASDGSGNVLLLWARDDDGEFYTELSGVTNGTNVDYENTDSHIYWTRWNGTGWNDPQALATGGKATRISPSIAFSPGNSALAVWTEKEVLEGATKYRLMYSIFNSGGSWSTSGQITENARFMEDPKAVVDSSGAATVIWRGYSGKSDAGGALYSSKGQMPAPSWSEPKQITHDDTVQWQADAVLDENNKVITLWSAYDASTGAASSGTGFGSGVNIARENPESAALTGTYSDRGVDANTDSIYEILEISVGVNILIAGDYRVQADLYKGDQYIASAHVDSMDLTAGNHTVKLFFPGGVIFDLGMDGPYILRNLIVMDCNDSPVQTAFADTAYTTTGTYNALDFVEGPLSLDAESYMGTGAKAFITVNNPAANTDPESAQTVSVAVSSTGDAKGFSIALIETGPNTGIFQRDMGFSLAAGSLELRRILISDHDMFRVIYHDSAYGYSFTKRALWMSAGAGDVNGDGDVDLADAILTLQSGARITPSDQGLTRAADVNGDEKIGVEEAIHIFRIMAE